MGFLKKITRPISRALDKLVPNEIKPALPFLAAAAPFMAPGLMSLGGNTMFSRALMSGGLNLGSQLAQEGSDGDFSGLSTLMAAATGAAARNLHGTSTPRHKCRHRVLFLLNSQAFQNFKQSQNSQNYHHTPIRTP